MQAQDGARQPGPGSGTESEGEENDTRANVTAVGAPRPPNQAEEVVDMLQRDQANEQVAALANEYRTVLGRWLAKRQPSLPDAPPEVKRNDLELLAEECHAKLGRRSTQPIATPDASQGNSRDNTVIIFDWDDTLFPTWFLQEVVLPCIPGNARDAKLPNDSPFSDTLATYASTLRAVLMVARAFGQVAIVTLAVRPWVLTSAERFLPGLDLAELLRRLEIPVFYARENIKRADACLAQIEEGVDVYTVAKRATMLKCLRKHYGKKMASSRSSLRMNVISVGDSLAERDAIKEVLWAASEQWPGESPLCKTVKFNHQPTMHHLDDQLRLLTMWLQRMAAHTEDFDISMDNPEDLTVRGHALFMDL